MKLHYHFLQLALATGISILPLSSFESLSAIDVVKLPGSTEYTEETLDQDGAIEKGFMRGKRGHRGHRGHRGKRGQQGLPGSGSQAVYSAHAGFTSSYTAYSEASDTIKFSSTNSNTNHDIGGLSFDEMGGQVIAGQSGLYEIHADVGFNSSDNNFITGDSTCEMYFTIIRTDSPYAQYLGSGAMSKSLVGSNLASITGSITNGIYLSQGDKVGISVIVRNQTAVALSNGLINFTVKLIDPNYVPEIN